MRTSDFALDHYKFWRVEGLPLGQTVPVKEHLGAEWDVRLSMPELLGNPALKVHDRVPYPIKNGALHYVAYRVDSDSPVHPPVVVLNQFTNGFERWELGMADWLLVPASKSLQGPPDYPPVGDHFLCYAVTKLDPRVTIQDQFDTADNRDKVEDITPMRPTHFCVPVQKLHGKNAEVRDRTTGLAMYAIPNDPYERQVGTRDQFREEALNVRHSEYLGVPSHIQE
jgi:hypothetical protein